MSRLFEELDYRKTPIGDLSLRRRRDLATEVDIYEIKLGDEFLMTSQFTASEIALARLGLAEVESSDPVDVVVGGLGLGYTAQEVLQNDRVASLTVVDALEAVIDWHRCHLLPLGPSLTASPRCKFVHGDFFKLSATPAGFDPAQPGRRFHAILVDIDHSPGVLLDAANAEFYQPEGLRQLAAHLHPGGVFGLWSNERPDDDFTSRLAGIFESARAETVTFANPLQGNEFTQTVYLAKA